MHISTYAASTHSPAQAVWKLWSNPQNWPLWDPALEKVELGGPFRQHVKGTLFYKDGRQVPFEVVSCHMLESFVVSIPYLRNTQLVIKRTLTQDGDLWAFEQETHLQGSKFDLLFLRGKKAELLEASGVQMSRMFEMLEQGLKAEGGSLPSGRTQQGF
ncbi:hypothetical protein [Deinococcus cellulosilyticus]|uniref:Polyketide cyclase n=1 Tax=Deinococcus cellulosilyticus (strain DSM 18568 / NBRC 106333 / KACC 11606 / 5516J-15) TaxID=1223518 RepID=A0A511N7A6_DEIC1|nr:hypothetical protein [Deinococcus cellulosilyticus]GEM48358.1 hypothetical protein DC3_39930 [Deinococcus cellulosilyticus NBRC 106333 = KACC 11606]